LSRQFPVKIKGNYSALFKYCLRSKMKRRGLDRFLAKKQQMHGVFKA
jgi:hypothetical protein